MSVSSNAERFSGKSDLVAECPRARGNEQLMRQALCEHPQTIRASTVRGMRGEYTIQALPLTGWLTDSWCALNTAEGAVDEGDGLFDVTVRKESGLS